MSKIKEMPNLRAVNTKTTTAEKKSAVAIPETIIIDKKKYRKVKLNEEFTLRQKTIATGIVQKILPKYFDTFDFETVEKILGNKSDERSVDLNYNGTTIRVNESTFAELKSRTVVNDVDFESELLALLYINEDEPHFCKDTYADRVEAFGNMPDSYEEGAVAAILDFFDSKLPSIVRGSQIYLEAMTKATVPAQ